MATHTSTITIHAPAQKVFDALTQPALVKLWQFGRVLTTDWKAGNAIQFKTEGDGNVSEQWGTVLEMRANELIKYNLFTPAPGIEDRIENYCVTSYVLTKDNDETRVEIIQEDNRPYGFTPATLTPILVSLKNVVETN